MDLLIKNVRIAEGGEPTDIGVEAGRITAIESGIDAKAARVIDAGGRAGIPGLLEPHLHLEKAMFARRMPAQTGTLEEAIRITGILKAKQEREDVLARSRQVLDMAIKAGTTFIRAHPDVDPIQGLIGVETALQLKEEYRNLLDLQIVAFPQEGILKSKGTVELLEQALRLGADVVGGCPYNEPSRADTEKHIEVVFDLSQKFSVPIDMHADFADDCSDARFAVSAYVAQRTIDAGMQGKVSLGHVTSLGALNAEEAKPVIELLHRADIHIVTLPATDLYLGGRKDEFNQRRGLTPVRRLRDGGVNVTYSSNNIRNAFTPFGKADPLLIGNFLAHVAQFGTPESQAAILDMGTYGAARSVGLAKEYGIKVGCNADIVILDTYEVADVLLDIPVRSWVIKRGKVTVETNHSCTIHRH
jgi:cytosine/creatinine deaminase